MAQDIQNIAVKKLKILSSVQPRESIDQDTASGWAELLAEDPTFQFPPGVAFQNPRTHDIVLADGFTRQSAYVIAERTLMPIDVREGDEGDATWFALGANNKHGRPLSPLERHGAIEKALRHRNRAELTNKELARALGVSLRMVERTITVSKKAATKDRIDKMPKDKFSAEALAAIDKIGLCNEQAKIAILQGAIKKPDDELIAFAEYDCALQLKLAPFFFTAELTLANAINAIEKRPTAIDRPLEEYILYTMMRGVDQQFYFFSDTVEVHIGLLAQTPEASIVKPVKARAVTVPSEDENLDDEGPL